MHDVSPELALVDPELGARLRSVLPDPPDCLAPRPRLRALVVAPLPPPLAELAPPRTPLVVVASPTTPWAPAPSHRPRRRLERVAATALWVPLAAVVGSSLLAFISSGSSQPQLQGPVQPATHSSSQGGSEKAGVGSRASSAAATPRARAPKSSRLVLRWHPVDDADFYDVVVVAGGKRRDFWPAGTHLAFGRGDGEAGVPIRWYVYPAYRVGGVVQFGKLHAQGQGTAILP